MPEETLPILDLISFPDLFGDSYYSTIFMHCHYNQILWLILFGIIFFSYAKSLKELSKAIFHLLFISFNTEVPVLCQFLLRLLKHSYHTQNRRMWNSRENFPVMRTVKGKFTWRCSCKFHMKYCCHLYLTYL